jgi:hypothetical protein
MSLLFLVRNSIAFFYLENRSFWVDLYYVRLILFISGLSANNIMTNE